MTSELARAADACTKTTPRHASGAQSGPQLKLRKANVGPDKGRPICITCSSAENNERRRLEKLQAAADKAWADADAETPQDQPPRRSKKKQRSPLISFRESLDASPVATDTTVDESVGTENVSDLLQEIERLSSVDVRSRFEALNKKMLDCDSDVVWDAYTERMRVIAKDTLAAASGRAFVAAPPLSL